jgi:adenosylcobinamide-GDP ribazoletransferase
VINNFLNAVGFLSVLPLRSKEPYQPGDLGRSALFYPLVGVFMGALTAGVNYLLTLLFPPMLTAALTLCFWIFITGGLHLDGVADCFDGILNASPPERRLEIMKDPQLGTFGGLGLILLILLKFSCLYTLPAQKTWLLLPFAMASSRWLLLLAGKQPNARPGGLGAEFSSGLKPLHFILAGLTILILIGIAKWQLGWMALVALLAAHLLALLIFYIARSRLGGLTGDVFGLLVEFSELLMLLIFTISTGSA